MNQTDRDNEPGRLGYEGRSSLSWGMRSFAQKVLAVLAAAVLLASAIAVSVVVFAVLIAGAAVGGAYLWWRTRDLRKQMRASSSYPSHASSTPQDVIEGEVISKVERDAEPHDRQG